MVKNYSWAYSVAMLFAGLILLGFEGAIARVLGYLIVIGVVVATYLRLRTSEDAVVRAANVAALTIGAPVGLGLAFLSIFLVRFVPDLGLYIDTLTAARSVHLGPGAAGFGVGVLFTCVVVVFAAVVAWVGWWIAMRR